MAGVPHLLAIGDNVVDCYPDLGWMYPGGNAVNVAVHAARLGVRSTYVGVLGDDIAGEAVLAALREEGVDTSALRVEHGENARAEVRIVDGNRVFGSSFVGVSRFAPSAADLAAVAAADLVHTGDCSMLEEHLPRLREHAGTLSFDFSEQPWDYVTAYAPLVDIAICSHPGTDPDAAEDLARRVRELGPRIVMVTQGAQGALLLDGGGPAHTAPAGDGPVVDTLGAGDAFAARALVGLLHGESPTTYLTAAAQYATAVCAEVGAFGHRTALPSPSIPSPATQFTGGTS